jgi:hypothetical protein
MQVEQPQDLAADISKAVKLASLDEHQTAATHPLDARTESKLNGAVENVEKLFSIRVQMRGHTFARKAIDFDDRKIPRRLFAGKSKCHELAQDPVDALRRRCARVGNGLGLRIELDSVLGRTRDELIDILAPWSGR